MPFYIEISEQAESDIEDIYDYTIDQFGLDQAFNYVSSFDETFQAIADHPDIGLDRSEIRHDLRSMVKDQHVVFYRKLSDWIRIIRILHGSRDIPKYF